MVVRLKQSSMLQYLLYSNPYFDSQVLTSYRKRVISKRKIY